VNTCFHDASNIGSLSLYGQTIFASSLVEVTQLPVTLLSLLYTAYFNNQITLWLYPKQPHLGLAL